MAYPREVRDTFKSLIDQNDKVIRSLEGVLSRTADQRHDVQRTLKLALEGIARRMLTPLDRDALSKLASVSGTVNIAQAYDQAVIASAKAQSDYTAYSEVHGDSATLQNSLKDKKQELADAELKKNKASDTLSTIDRRLGAAIGFMQKYPGKHDFMTQGDVDYFKSKSGVSHVWAWCTDQHYREGRRILRNYEAAGLSTVTLWEQQALYTTECEQLYGLVANLSHERDALQSKANEARRLLSLIVDEETIRLTMHKDIVAQLRDKTTLNRAAIMIPQYVSDNTVELWVKADAYARMESRLQAQKKSIKGINDNLNKPMSKLNTAVSRGVTTNIKIDLKDTVAKVQTAQVTSRHLMTEMSKASKCIERFSVKSPRTQLQIANAGLPVRTATDTSTYTTTDLFTMYLIYNMMTPDSSADISTAVDPAAVQMTLGIPDEAAHAAGLEVSNLVPQLDPSTISSLEAMGGNISIDTGNLDHLVGNIDVSMPNLGSFDVSVPEVSISMSEINVTLDTGPAYGGGDYGGGDFSGGGD